MLCFFILLKICFYLLTNGFNIYQSAYLFSFRCILLATEHTQSRAKGLRDQQGNICTVGIDMWHLLVLLLLLLLLFCVVLNI